MADKTIIINGVTFGRGTGVKIDENAEYIEGNDEA